MIENLINNQFYPRVKTTKSDFMENILAFEQNGYLLDYKKLTSTMK